MQTDSPSSSVASSPGGKGKSSTASPLSTSDQHVSNSSSSTEVESIQFSGHSGFAKSHLDQVAEKLQNKMQAMTVYKN